MSEKQKNKFETRKALWPITWPLGSLGRILFGNNDKDKK
jgi:hypothetical protein